MHNIHSYVNWAIFSAGITDLGRKDNTLTLFTAGEITGISVERQRLCKLSPELLFSGDHLVLS